MTLRRHLLSSFLHITCCHRYRPILCPFNPYLLLFDRHCPLLTDQNIDNPVKRRDLRIAVTVFQFSEQVLGGLFCVLIFLKCLFFRKFFRLKSKRPPQKQRTHS